MRPLLLAVLLIAASAVSQEFPIKGPATNDPSANSSRLQTFQGCLTRSKSGLMLKNISKQEFRLVGSKSLDSYVGEEVRITGHNVNPGDPSSDEHSMGVAQPQNAPATLAVEDIQKISDRCAAKK